MHTYITSHTKTLNRSLYLKARTNIKNLYSYEGAQQDRILIQSVPKFFKNN